MKSTELNRIDCALMKVLKSKECIDYFTGMTIQELIVYIGISRISAYRRLCILVDLGYVHRACKSVNADTYYITEKGINLIEVVGGEQEDVKG